MYRAIRKTFLANHNSKHGVQGYWRIGTLRHAHTSPLKVSREVQDAIKNGRPVVALETTIYTHGFPYPENLQLATRLEDVVRQNGAVPATIGVLDGVAHVGLQRDSLAQLVKRPHARKISRRDLGFALGSVNSGDSVLLREAQG